MAKTLAATLPWFLALFLLLIVECIASGQVQEQQQNSERIISTEIVQSELFITIFSGNSSKTLSFREDQYLNELYSDKYNDSVDSHIKRRFYSSRDQFFRPRDCKVFKDKGGIISGVYTLYPTGNSENSISAYCDLATDSGGWTVFQRRLNGKTDFYMNWDNYTEGFGNPADEYWLGNKYLYQLTKDRACQLKIDMINRANISAYALYTNFSIGDESDGFRLTIGTLSGSVAFDALRLHDGMKFTTRDRDNDFKDDRNCAVSAWGAWWYDACYDSNLNGMYGVGDGRGLMWKNYLNDIIMRDTTMKLKCA